MQPLGVAETRHRHLAFVPGAVERDGATTGCGQEPNLVLEAGQAS